MSAADVAHLVRSAGPLDVAAEVVKAWAQDFDKRHAGVRDPRRLRELWQADQTAIYHLSEKRGRLRRAIASLDFTLFITGLVHYQSTSIARDKVRELTLITGESISRRDYYNKLDRVHYFVAGCVFEQSDAGA